MCVSRQPVSANAACYRRGIRGSRLRPSAPFRIVDQDAIIVFEAGELMNFDLCHLMRTVPALGGSVRVRKLIAALRDFNGRSIEEATRTLQHLDHASPMSPI